jgi:uncharacterized membrane protein YoaK (UPF0700 family)
MTNAEAPVKEKTNFNKYVKGYMNTLFKGDYERKEAIYVLIGAVIVALNTGFINGICMSPEFLTGTSSPGSTETTGMYRGPSSQGISGTGGSFTKSGRYLVEAQWQEYKYITVLILAYIFGAFIAGIITPRAHKHVIEPTYGPTFFIGALFLLAASLFAEYGLPSRFIFYFGTAALGVQNGIASIYSANLIRCTLTGTSTDIGLIIAQALRGNFDKFIRGTLIAVIVSNYFIGGVIAVPAVNAMHFHALWIAVGLFFLLGTLCLAYTVFELGVSLYDGLFGTWNWKHVLDNLFDDESGVHTVEDFMKLFDEIDRDSDLMIDVDELRNGLKTNDKIKLSDFKLRALMRAADSDNDDLISRDEWEELAKKTMGAKEVKA